MGDFLRLILDSLHYLWPFRVLQQWERGIYTVLGRWVFDIGPGLKVFLPFFTEIYETSMVWDVQHLARHDITTKNGQVLSFEATVTFRVIDARKALMEVHDYDRSVTELAGSLIAESLAEMDPARLAPERRRGLVKTIVADVRDEAAAFGVEIQKVRFSSFVLNPRTYRLLMEH